MSLIFGYFYNAEIIIELLYIQNEIYTCTALLKLNFNCRIVMNIHC